MRICFVSFEYPPFMSGGAGVYAVHITRELAKMGHDVHIISPSISGQRTHSVESGISVDRIPIIDKRFLKAPSFWVNLAREFNEIRKDAGGFDILHGNGDSDFSLFKQRIKEPRVVTVHHLASLVAQNVTHLNRLLDLSGETGFTPIIEKAVISRANRIIAVSNFTKKTLFSTYNVSPSKIEVIPNGINVDEYFFSKDVILKCRKMLGLDDSVAFLFVGRLNDPRKNLPHLLKAFRITCRDRRKRLKLVLVGSGNQLKIKKIVYRLGIEKDVLVLGYVKDSLLRKYYNACDVLVSPSLLEGFGLTILEAMAAGKPVIALNVGAIPELVREGVNGFLIDKQDLRSLANTMSFLADHPDIIESIGVRNREYVANNFSWQKSAKLTERVYKTLLDSA